MKMVPVLIIHLIVQLLAAKVETESCLLKFIEEPPSSLTCNPYNSYKRWGLRLTCQVEKSVNSMSVEYEIHWFQKDQNNDIIDHGRSHLSHKTGTVEMVEFGGGWYGQNFTNDMLGDFWCQVKLTDREPPVYLSKSNVLTVREPNYYNSSLPPCPGLLFVKQTQCLTVPSFTSYNTEITPTQTTFLNTLTTHSISLQSFTTIVTDIEHPNTASDVLTTTITTTTTICLNIPSSTSYNPEILPTQTTFLNTLTTHSISLQSFTTTITDIVQPNTACYVLTTTITTAITTTTTTTTTTSKWLSSVKPTFSAKSHNFMDYVLPGIIILSAIVTMIILIIFAIIMVLILRVKRKKIRSPEITVATPNHQTSKEAEEDLYTTNMEPYYAPLTTNTTHKPLDNPYYQPNAIVTDVIIYENDDRNIARHKYAAINPAQIENDVYTSLRNNIYN